MNLSQINKHNIIKFNNWKKEISKSAGNKIKGKYNIYLWMYNRYLKMIGQEKKYKINWKIYCSLGVDSKSCCWFFFNKQLFGKY